GRTVARAPSSPTKEETMLRQWRAPPPQRSSRSPGYPASRLPAPLQPSESGCGRLLAADACSARSLRRVPSLVLLRLHQQPTGELHVQGGAELRAVEGVHSGLVGHELGAFGGARIDRQVDVVAV